MFFNRSKNTNRVSSFIAACLAVITASSVAEEQVVAESDTNNKGYSISERSSKINDGYMNFTAQIKMTLRGAKGEVAERTLRQKVLEFDKPGYGDKALIVFDSPFDIRGSALLSHTKIQGNDDQWLYLPELKRVKRISSRNKSGSFLGSEFSFEDLASPELEKFTYKYLSSKPCFGDDTSDPLICDLVERVPAYENSGYTKQIGWIDQEKYLVHKVESFDLKGDLFKTLISSQYQKYADKYWKPNFMSMTNHLTGNSTEFSISDYNFETELNVGEFEKSGMSRIR